MDSQNEGRKSNSSGIDFFIDTPKRFFPFNFRKNIFTHFLI